MVGDGFVITQPTCDGHVRPLARYEWFRLSLTVPEGVISGTTQVLGRFKSRSDGNVIFGYRMSMPETIDTTYRRRDLETLMGDNALREAELHVFGRQGPIHGLVEDMNSSGAQLRCRNGGQHLRCGEEAFFKMNLSDTIGSIWEPAQIVAAEMCPETSSITVRVTFASPNHAIGEALRRAKANP